MIGGIFLVVSIIIGIKKVSTMWEIYVGVYTTLMLLYIWYPYILIFYNNLKKKTRLQTFNPKVSVIIPCYNEDPELLIKCVKSIQDNQVDKEIIIGDDGSNNGVENTIKRLKNEFKNIRTFSFRKNKGKRHVLDKAIRISNYDIIVTTDSDTILEKSAIGRLIAPLQKKQVGGTTGNVDLLNEKTNLLTRMIGAYYWIGLNIYKASQSTLGNVVCCSGCLSAYKKEVLINNLKSFREQKFLGEVCTHSEDRHLTNLILRDGHKVLFVPEAICYTFTPDTYKGFLKQQLRWKRGFFRESLYTLTYSFKRSKILFFETFIFGLTIPFLSLGIRLGVLFSFVFFPVVFWFTIVPFWIVTVIVRNILLFLLSKKKALASIPYIFFYEFVLYWLNIYALFTMKNKSWITR